MKDFACATLRNGWKKISDILLNMPSPALPRTSTLYLTGLRGYSALGVYLIHAGEGIRNFNAYLDKVIDFGKYGVVVFFFLSALSLSISIGNSNNFNYYQYLARRFARIFPMYFIAITFFWFIDFKDSSYDFIDLFAHLTFLNYFEPSLRNSIIGIEWSVPIEMAMYLVIPVLLIWLAKVGIGIRLFLLLLSIVLSMIADFLAVYPSGYTLIATRFEIQEYFYCFVAGVITYTLFESIHFKNIASDILVTITLVLIFIVCQTFVRVPISLTILIMVLVLALGNARFTRALFENTPILFVGKISYSFYLLHFPIVIYLGRILSTSGASPWLTLVLGLAATVPVAFLCYEYIEKPFLKLAPST